MACAIVVGSDGHPLIVEMETGMSRKQIDKVFFDALAGRATPGFVVHTVEVSAPHFVAMLFRHDVFESDASSLIQRVSTHLRSVLRSQDLQKRWNEVRAAAASHLDSGDLSSTTTTTASLRSAATPSNVVPAFDPLSPSVANTAQQMAQRFLSSSSAASSSQASPSVTPTPPSPPPPPLQTSSSSIPNIFSSENNNNETGVGVVSSPPAAPPAPIPTMVSLPTSPSSPPLPPSPRPPAPTLEAPPPPTMLPECPLEPPVPSISSDWTPSSSLVVSPQHSVRMIEQVTHFSSGKELLEFHVSGYIEMVLSQEALNASGTGNGIRFTFSLVNHRFIDRTVFNPNLDIVSPEPGVFDCTINDCTPLLGHPVHLMRFIVRSQFPPNRVPMRLVPTVTSKALQIVYEMNPFVENIDRMTLEMYCEKLHVGVEAGLDVKLGKRTGEPVEYEADVKNNIFRAHISNISREQRRDKLLVTSEAMSQMHWKGVAVGFAVKRKALSQVFLELKNAPIAVLAPEFIATHYFAVHGQP